LNHTLTPPTPVEGHGHGATIGRKISDTPHRVGRNRTIPLCVPATRKSHRSGGWIPTSQTITDSAKQSSRGGRRDLLTLL